MLSKDDMIVPVCDEAKELVGAPQPSSVDEYLEEDVAHAPLTPTLQDSSRKKTASATTTGIADKVRHRGSREKQSLSISAKDTSDEKNVGPPGAIPVQGMSPSAEQTQGDDDDDMVANSSVDDHDPHGTSTTQAVLTARVVPDGEEIMAAMLANQMEMQIKEAVQAQLSQQQSRQKIVLAEPAEAGTSSNGSNKNPTTPPSEVCGLSARAWAYIAISMVVIVVLLVVATITVVMLASQSASPSASPSAPQNKPTDAPSVGGLRQELEPWIARTEMDRLMFDDNSSPQSLALHWLSNDPYQSSLSNENSVKEKVERYALAVLYFSTDGPNWFDKELPFLSASNACDWNNGRVMLQDDNARGVFCSDLSSSLLFMNLRRNNLNGTIPWELSLLSDLYLVFLDENELKGKIPSELGTMRNLESVYLSYNSLKGPLPTKLPSTLRVINFSFNSFTSVMTLGLQGQARDTDE